MPDGSIVGTSGGKKIMSGRCLILSVPVERKRAVKNKKIFYFATDMRRHTQTKTFLSAISATSNESWQRQDEWARGMFHPPLSACHQRSSAVKKIAGDHPGV